MGYSLFGGSAVALLHGCKADKKTDWSPKVFDEDQSNMMSDLCETILPATDTPGAKDALCHRFIDEMLANFYSKEEQKVILDELKVFDNQSKLKYSKAFVALTPSERESILQTIAKDKSTANKTIRSIYPNHTEKYDILSFVKEATVFGYFTSEVGAKGGLGEFLPVPGPYQGCIEYSTVGKVYVI